MRAGITLLVALIMIGAIMVERSRRQAGPADTSAAASRKALPVLGTVPPFELTDQAGRPVSLDSFDAPWVAAFMFTRCTSICPRMTGRMKTLAAKVPGLRLVSFTLDPYDTPKRLARYAERHRADWDFLSGKSGAVRDLSLYGFKLGASVGTGRNITHSNRLILVDRKKQIRGYFDPEAPAERTALYHAASRLVSDR